MTKYLLLAVFLFFRIISIAQKTPETIIFDGKILAMNKSLVLSKTNKEKTDAVKKLIKKCDALVSERKTYSVMNKKQTPPSGDKHDYMSTGPYWWPDPSKPDGLPYIRKDGQVNPTYHDISDTIEMDYMEDDVEDLALGYYFSDDENYAIFAVELIKTWFLNKETKQNPNLNFGQGIPGISTGRGIGLIETRRFYKVIDAAIILRNSRAWSNKDHAALKTWMKDFLTWMTTDKRGLDEAKSKNNHGTYYDMQVVCYAIFSDQKDLAIKHLNESTKARFAVQFTPEGSQPLELERTASWSYTNMNLLGFMQLGRMAEQVGVDLYNYTLNDKLSIKNTIDYFIPFYKKQKTWPFEQIKTFKNDTAVQILKTAAIKYKNKEYDIIASILDPKEYNNYTNILTL